MLIIPGLFSFTSIVYVFQCAAVIVDTDNNRVMGKAYSRCLRSDTECGVAGHVLQHAVMLAIDSVAHTHGGGVWSTSATDHTSPSHGAVKQ